MDVAALFVETAGAYFGVPGVDPWDEPRDARKYAGHQPVVAHPPCQRWGRYWHGAPNKPHQFRLGEDGGCFAAALTAVRNYGGVLEHPADSHAWGWFGLKKPPARGPLGARRCVRRLDLLCRTGALRSHFAQGHMAVRRRHRPT